MSRWCDWFAVTSGEADALLAARKQGEAAVHAALLPWLERLEKLPVHAQMDKAWEPIYRCLNGIWSYDLSLKKRPKLLSLAVHGGDQLARTGRRTASLVVAGRVPGVARALAKVEKAWMREEFFLLPKDAFFHEINDEMFEWTWAHFEDLPPFFAEAAGQGGAVVCTISH